MKFGRTRVFLPGLDQLNLRLAKGVSLGCDPSPSGVRIFHLDRLADASPTRETPFVGESGTLCRFDWVNRAAFPIQENTTAICLVLQR